MSTYEIVLRNGMLVDGSGEAPRPADVAVDGTSIAAVDDGLRGHREIDCSDLVIAPGFIDTHSHSDLRVFTEPLLPMKIRQGITLEVLGQDGISVAPVRSHHIDDTRRALSGLLGSLPKEEWRWERVRDYLKCLEAAKPVLNLAYLVPHGTLRTYVMGRDNRKPTPAEIGKMTAELARALEEGALGMSTGLIYPPCCFADTDELVALGQVLAPRRAPLVAHMRSESDLIERAIDEMMEVGLRSRCPVHISHLKIAGRENFARVGAVIARLEEARAQGVSVTGDQYCYAAGSTLFGAILPPWAHDGGPAKTLERLRDPASRKKLRQDIEKKGVSSWDSFWRWTGPEGIVISGIASGRHPELLGKNVAEAARQAGKEPLEFALDLLESEALGIGMVSHSQSEDVVEKFLPLPFLNGCTDALLGSRPHPRAYGTFPRFLARYVREKKLVELPEMVRKLTSQAARAMNLTEVGEVRPGFAADLVVFDPASVRDTATYEDPVSYPEGIVHVMVRGEMAVEDSHLTGVRAGQVVRRPLD
ncbi:MAG TPA: D-aminoacylase [Vicinamibacteria bacterium]|jgi:N-acyl-D-amino-acid deacylase